MKKLIRDKIPDLVRQKPREGEKIFIIEDKQELINYILDKIKEEQKELFEEIKSNNPEKILEELADNFEILEALGNNFGFSFDDIIKTKKEKKEKRGGFEKGYVLIR